LEKTNIEKLLDLYYVQNTIWVRKSRRMRWAGHLTRMGEKRNSYRFWWGNWKQRDKLEDLSLDGTIGLNEIG